MSRILPARRLTLNTGVGATDIQQFPRCSGLARRSSSGASRVMANSNVRPCKLPFLMNSPEPLNPGTTTVDSASSNPPTAVKKPSSTSRRFLQEPAPVTPLLAVSCAAAEGEDGGAGHAGIPAGAIPSRALKPDRPRHEFYGFHQLPDTTIRLSSCSSTS